MSGFAVSPLKQDEGAMPWSASSFAGKHNHSLKGAAASKAASIANAILKRGGDEGVAIATANKRVGLMRKAGTISDKAARKTGLDAPQDVDASTA